MARRSLLRLGLLSAALALPLSAHASASAAPAQALTCRYTRGAAYVYRLSEVIRDHLTGPNLGLYQAYGQPIAPTGGMSETNTWNTTLTYHVLNVAASGDATVLIQSSRGLGYTVVDLVEHGEVLQQQHGDSEMPGSPVTVVLHPDCSRTGGLSSSMSGSLVSLMTLPHGTAKVGARWQSADVGTELGPNNAATTVQVRHTLVHGPSSSTPGYGLHAVTSLSYADALTLSATANVPLTLTEAISADGVFSPTLGHFSAIFVHNVQQGTVVTSSTQQAGHLTETLDLSLQAE